MRPIDKQLARCVGLWIAEGDKKTIAEITFTNNSNELIELFYKTLRKIFRNANFRLYVYYNPNIEISNFKINIETIKFYKDKRARKQYYILRFANRKAVVKWNKTVKKITSDKSYYPYILQGIFAGEGNLKEGSNYSRQLRIAQKIQLKLIDTILEELGINYTFSLKGRSYVISGRKNWETFYKMKIAILHPDKRMKFLKMYRSFKEWHYKHNYIRNSLLTLLKEPNTTSELARLFNRKQSRIQDVVIELKKQGLICNFRVLSKDYWILNNSNKVIISQRKNQILDMLETPKRTFEVAKQLNVDHKSALKRLRELEKLNLVVRNDLYWEKLSTDKEVVVI